MPDLGHKLPLERDRLIQQLAGFCDALLCATPEQLADVVPVVPGIEAIVDRVRKLGVAVTTEYPEADAAIDPKLLSGLLAGASLLRNN